MEAGCIKFSKGTIEKIAGKINHIFVKPIELKDSFLELAARFSGDPGTVILLSGGDLDCARYHMLAICPWLEIKSVGRQITLTSDRKFQHF